MYWSKTTKTQFQEYTQGQNLRFHWFHNDSASQNNGKVICSLLEAITSLERFCDKNYLNSDGIGKRTAKVSINAHLCEVTVSTPQLKKMSKEGEGDTQDWLPMAHSQYMGNCHWGYDFFNFGFLLGFMGTAQQANILCKTAHHSDSDYRRSLNFVSTGLHIASDIRKHAFRSLQLDHNQIFGEGKIRETLIRKVKATMAWKNEIENKK